MPYITNLRLDPFERMGWPNNGTKEGAQQYFDWFKYEFWRFVFVQQVMGKELQTFLDYPPMQRGASFNLDAIKAEMAKRMQRGGGGQQRPEPVNARRIAAGGCVRVAQRDNLGASNSESSEEVAFQGVGNVGKRARLWGLVAVAIGALLGYLTATGKPSALLSADVKEPAAPVKAADAGPADQPNAGRVDGPGRAGLLLGRREARADFWPWPIRRSPRRIGRTARPPGRRLGRSCRPRTFSPSRRRPPRASPAARCRSRCTSQRVEPRRLPKDAPNILIVLIDDVGAAQSSTFGGLINTPTMDRIVKQGVAYNRFHTTAMCSPTRAALLCGRNQHRVGSGQIAELANDWDGYAGTIPKSSATVAEVLKDYGYATSAFGKWHNTPGEETTAAGPFDHWPSGYGFDYFYGFLAGEASQYEPCLVRNTTYVQHPHTSGGHDYYHLSEDLADDAINYLHRHKAFEPDKPFFMYWASGAVHGPHHVMKEWADKYKGKFDDGWDKYRERAFKNAKDKGWIPANAVNTPRPADLASWESIPEDQRPFQRRLMEVYAGFTEHVDHEVGRLVDEIDHLGYGDNTLILYIWGDNGASAEGQNGTISELLAQNGIPSTVEQHIKALDALGGLDVLGSPKTDNMYHAGWAWAGGAPYKGTKLLASHFGGTRDPMGVRWPARIKPDPTPRPQFHHVNDIAPTIYEILGITPPRVVNGVPQDPIDGVSFAYTFNDAKAKDRKHTQYFEVMGSRSIYHDGWMASAFGPRVPWKAGMPTGHPGMDPR